LNVDGSSLGNLGVSGFGGLLRNDNGAWILGFVGNIDFSNIFHAELLAMYHGLEVTNLVCYSDSKTAINLIFATVNDWHHYAPIIRNIHELLARDQQVRVLHTREGNACADYLAKLDAGSHESFWSIEHLLLESTCSY
jgi:ribonuclease HI